MLAEYTANLMARTSLSDDDMKAAFRPCGIFGPKANPPDQSTWRILQKILPCHLWCAEGWMGDDVAVAAAMVTLAMREINIPRLGHQQKNALQMVAAQELESDRHQRSIPLQRSLTKPFFKINDEDVQNTSKTLLYDNGDAKVHLMTAEIVYKVSWTVRASYDGTEPRLGRYQEARVDRYSRIPITYDAPITKMARCWANGTY